MPSLLNQISGWVGPGSGQPEPMLSLTCPPTQSVGWAELEPGLIRSRWEGPDIFLGKKGGVREGKGKLPKTTSKVDNKENNSNRRSTTVEN